MMPYTKVDNWLFDVVMPATNPNTFKIVATVVRLTAGWQRDTATISYSDFQKLTGIGNRTTISNAIQDAINSGWIERENCTSTEIGLVQKPYLPKYRYRTKTSPEIGLRLVQKSDLNTPTEIKGKKIKEKRKKEKVPVVEQFTPPIPNAYMGLIPTHISTESFLSAWNDWIEYHAERGKPLTRSTAKAQLNEIGKLPAGEGERRIAQSIAQGWTGLFQLKSGKNGTEPAKVESEESRRARLETGYY